MKAAEIVFAPAARLSVITVLIEATPDALVVAEPTEAPPTAKATVLPERSEPSALFVSVAASDTVCPKEPDAEPTDNDVAAVVPGLM